MSIGAASSEIEKFTGSHSLLRLAETNHWMIRMEKHYVD